MSRVGVDDEPRCCSTLLRFQLLEVNHAGRYAAGGELGGGQGAGFWVGDGLGLLGLGEPGVELADGGGAIEVGEGEFGEGELVSLAGSLVAGWGD